MIASRGGDCPSPAMRSGSSVLRPAGSPCYARRATDVAPLHPRFNMLAPALKGGGARARQRPNTGGSRPPCPPWSPTGFHPARFLYVQRTAFGGKVHGRTFGVDPRNPGAFDVTKLGPVLEAVHERLAGVVIERLPWPDFIARYDRPETLFYLDPPYYGCERDYGPELFNNAMFEQMASQLSGLRGRFILSLNDRPETRAIFARFAIETVPVTYQIGGGDRIQRITELVISGGAGE